MTLILVVLCMLVVWFPASHSIFTDFDLVRPREAWGSDGTTPYIKIDARTNNGPNCSESAMFGSSVAVVGDIDGNGIDDIVVGAIGELSGAGGIYIMFMNQNGSVIRSMHISSLINGGPRLYPGDEFGFAVAALGDLDGDSVPDVAVSAPSTVLSSVYIFYLNNDGSVKDTGLIRGKYEGGSSSNVSAPSNESYTVNGPPFSYGSRFGTAITALGDMDGDGVTELGVSSVDRGGGRSRVYVLYMMANSTIKHYTFFGPGGVGNGPLIQSAFSGFGSALLAMPDFDGDNISEIVVGARFMYDAGSVNRRAGKSYVCFLHANGTVKRSTELGELSLAPGQKVPNVVSLKLHCFNKVFHLTYYTHFSFHYSPWMSVARPSPPSATSIWTPTGSAGPTRSPTRRDPLCPTSSRAVLRAPLAHSRDTFS